MSEEPTHPSMSGPRPATADTSLREVFSNRLWATVVKTRNWLKRVGLLGPLDGLTSFLGPRLLRPPKTETRVLMPHDLALTLPAGLPSHRNYATGLYEVDVTAVVSSILHDGMAVLDIGANIGYYTLLASRLVGESGHVYSFEPDPEVFMYLEQNALANRCVNVTSINKAVGATVGAVTFQRVELERGFVSKGGLGALTVEQVTVDRYFSDLGWPPVDLVKIDIEGSEEDALRGMQNLISHNPRLRLIMELNMDAISRTGGTLASLIETIGRLGFTACYVIELRRYVALDELLAGSRAIHNLLLSSSSTPAFRQA